MVVALRDGDAGAELAPQAGVADLERLARARAAGRGSTCGSTATWTTFPRPWTPRSTASCRSR